MVVGLGNFQGVEIILFLNSFDISRKKVSRCRFGGRSADILESCSCSRV